MVMRVLDTVTPETAAAADDAAEHAFPPLPRHLNVLMVWPRVPVSFWGHQHTSLLIPERAPIPPLGLITVAALCPSEWTIRLIDQNLQEVSDHAIRSVDLVMVSGMRVQSEAMREILARARALGKRTMVGGPYVSSEPDALLSLADHVVVGEPDVEMPRIISDLHAGSARRLYVIKDKPDITGTPIPRFDLLQRDSYTTMAVQFSRGCPFQCEFCDIITIYGRRPRTKRNSQMLAEFDALFRLGWRKPVFIVDDNFIGNHKLALELVTDLQEWSRAHRYPFAFFTEASLDLAQRPALLESMVRANFFAVFLGIETPSRESLQETKKYQNLRIDPLESVRVIQDAGLWVMGGFIVGFDSDTPDIFERQREFIEGAAIPWAMLGFLEAVPNTPLYDRMLKEGRLIQDKWRTNFDPPNFRTIQSPAALVKGVRDTLQSLYSPSVFYERALRSLTSWNIRPCQHPPVTPLLTIVTIALRALWYQGVTSNYRKAWWKYLFQVMRRWAFVPMKLWWGCALLTSGHHFTQYGTEVVEQLTAELRAAQAGSSGSRAAVA
jgi:radical SAM superfamily enzyme YgiQ (UPF0313 family)